MASLIVGRDSQIMMLEVGVEKLFVPNSSPFDAVILSKFIVSFRFLDDDWIEITPNRLDYKNYRGSSGEAQPFHGGKSIVFSVPESMLAKEQKGLDLELNVRREISRYFETQGLGHVMDLGQGKVCLDELFNGLVKELKIRCDLGDYLRLAHERDPISSSLKRKIPLEEAREGTELELYVRLSHLGGCVVTEIDRPIKLELRHFYAQEENNLAKPYECLELRSEECPDASIPASTIVRARPSLQLDCACNEEQKYEQVVMDQECKRTTSTTTRQDKKEDDEPKKKKTTTKTKDRGINTDADRIDKSIGTPGQIVEERKKDKDKDKKEKEYVYPKKRRGSGPMVYIEKSKPCPTPEPCCPTVCEIPCDLPCLPTTPVCPPPVCCYE